MSKRAWDAVTMAVACLVIAAVLVVGVLAVIGAHSSAQRGEEVFQKTNKRLDGKGG